MIESLMLFTLGFLIATLFAIIASQFIWRRAVTVTTRNLVGTDPAGEGEDHAALRELLDDRNARLTELSTRLEKLEANEPPFPDAGEAKEREHQAEAEAETVREMEHLRTRLSELEAELAGSQAVRQAQDDDLAAINRRIADFEAALAEDARRKDQSHASLRGLGERAARLAYDLNNIIEEIAPRAETRKGVREIAGESAREKSEEKPEEEQPGETGDEKVADTLEELNDRVQAAYGAPSPEPSPATEDPMGDDDDKLDDEHPAPKLTTGKPGASPLDERIRALEAGLPH